MSNFNSRGFPHHRGRRLRSSSNLRDIVSQVKLSLDDLVMPYFIKEIKDNNQVAIYYCNNDGKIEEEFNPNGSIKNIAGILNKEKNVLGMMPHPERMIDSCLSGKDGSLFFKNLLNNIK